MTKLVRRGAIAGALAGLLFGVWKFLESRAPDTGGVTYQAQPFPMPPKPVPPKPVAPKPIPEAPAAVDPTADPDGEGQCPLTHPVKGKITSGIYHQPGGFAYQRTKADRCYRDPQAAESDGLRAAKR